MRLEDYVLEIKQDVKELRKDVQNLLTFMALEKERAKRSAIIAGGTMSLIVSVLVILAEKYI